MPIITLTTDFGTTDAYVGVMKGVILGIAPGATIVDLSHQVPPQDVLAGAMVLESAGVYFPQGTIHVAVIDPGVGGGRIPIAIQTQRNDFLVGPDNGLFTAILQRDPMAKAVSLTNSKFHRAPVIPIEVETNEVSTDAGAGPTITDATPDAQERYAMRISDTFHGRDLFAPVAAHLANGTPLDQLGEPISALTKLDLPEPLSVDHDLQLRVITIDHFGNLVTNLTAQRYDQWHAEHSQPPQSPRLRIGEHRIRSIRRTFSDAQPDQLVAYWGSTGRLEIAVRNGHAAQFLQAEVGVAVYLSLGGG